MSTIAYGLGDPKIWLKQMGRINCTVSGSLYTEETNEPQNRCAHRLTKTPMVPIIRTIFGPPNGRN